MGNMGPRIFEKIEEDYYNLNSSTAGCVEAFKETCRKEDCIMKRCITLILTCFMSAILIIGCGSKEQVTEPIVVEENPVAENPEVDIESTAEEDVSETQEEQSVEEEESTYKEYLIDIDKSAEYDYYYVDSDGNRLIGINVPPILEFHTDTREITEGTRVDLTVFGDELPCGYIYCVSGHNARFEDYEFLAGLQEHSESGEEYTLPVKNQYNDTWTASVELYDDIRTSDRNHIYTYAVKARPDQPLMNYISYYLSGKLLLEIVYYDPSVISNRLWSMENKELLTAMLDADYSWGLEYYISDEAVANQTAWESYKSAIRTDEMISDQASETKETKTENDTDEAKSDEENKTDNTGKSVESGVSSSYILLADGSKISVGGDVNLADLNGASFVIGGSETVWFAAIGSPGVYRLSSDPEPNWAYESQYSAGTKVSLAPYVSYFSDPSYDYLTIETRGNTDNEYSFHIVR